MIPIPIIALPIAMLVTLLLSGGAWFMGDNHGTFVERAAQTQQRLVDAKDTIKKMGDEQKNAVAAADNHDHNATNVNVDTSAIGRALQNALAKIPPSSDPLMPVWFVRMFDRGASRFVGADPYPGKPDNDPSDVRLSEASTLLEADLGKCETNRVQLTDLIAYIKDANSRRETVEPKSLLDRLGL